MSEGQNLAKEIHEKEKALKLRIAKIRELESENEHLQTKLSTEITKNENLTKEKLELTKTLKDIEELQKSQLQIQKTQFEALLKDANDAQVSHQKHNLKQFYVFNLNLIGTSRIG